MLMFLNVFLLTGLSLVWFLICKCRCDVNLSYSCTLAALFLKRGNCECIATWCRPTPRQSSSALSTTPMPSLKSFNLSAAVLQRFCCFTLWPWPLTRDLDFWPLTLKFWTSALYRLWRDETLYQIWTQSSNPRRSNCDFNIWPYMTLNMCYVVLRSAMK